MPFSRAPDPVTPALANKVRFPALMAVGFFGLLIYGLQPQALPVQQGAEYDLFPGEMLTLRQDTPMPKCDASRAMNGLIGALVRAKRVRISGLTDVAQITEDAAGNRSCRAVVNLDFGTQPVAYTIFLLTPGRKTWELAVTGP